MTCWWLLAVACGDNRPGRSVAADSAEPRLDSAAIDRATAKQAFIRVAVTADAESTPELSRSVPDHSTDDIAIWYDFGNPEMSRILATNGKQGISVYNLDGNELASYAVGRINQVDVLQGVVLGGDTLDIAGGANVTDQSIDLFRITNGLLEDLAAHEMLVDTALMKGVNGCCFYPGHEPYLFVNGMGNIVQQFRIVMQGDGKLNLAFLRQFTFDSRTWGMVADAAYGVVYISEEDKGVWRLWADPDSSATPMFVGLSDEMNPNVAFDVRGLALYQQGRNGYLVMSAGGNFSFALFDRAPGNAYLGSFKILGGDVIDGVEATDGIAVSSLSFGTAFPHGMFIAHDGLNSQGDTLQDPNFKIVRWEKIALAMGL